MNHALIAVKFDQSQYKTLKLLNLGLGVNSKQFITGKYEELGYNFIGAERPTVCIQGLGFVGAAMAMATAMARNKEGKPIYNVIGVDLANDLGKNRIDSFNQGQFPIQCEDQKLIEYANKALEVGNFVATHDEAAYSVSDIVLIDIHCDVLKDSTGHPQLDLTGLKNAFKTILKNIKKGGLVIVETTVPPGTCERVLQPILDDALLEKNWDKEDILLAHSYERVMPGKNYLDSIINFWRVYSGTTEKAANECEMFLGNVINIKDYPLTRLASTTASESAKILENSYRAVNIAFMEEWGRFAEAVNIDLFEIIKAIRQRPTHNNIRQPGFAVGGYCLTKDPLFPELSAKHIFELKDLEFGFCKQAVNINNRMPLASIKKIEKEIGFWEDKNILLLGLSYLPDVADTRYSGSQIFYEHVLKKGAKINIHDPIVFFWNEINIEVPKILPDPKNIDVVVFAVAHKEYIKRDWVSWLSGCCPLIFDANNVLSIQQRKNFREVGCKVLSIGRGENCE